jgi:hypothetical protein
MCIFSLAVESVSKTRIFARLTEKETQFLVYQMAYESAETNAMILPIPVRQPTDSNTMRFISLKSYSNFFDDLAKGFPFKSPFISIGCGGPKSAQTMLDVLNVGNYIASFVPTLSDFSRLDERFTLPASTWAKVPQYANYGFAVFQLAAGSLTPHPMAFEFKTATEEIYFPTLHIHDGEVHKAEEFDHVLYLQHAGFDSRVYPYQNANELDESTGLVRSEHAAKTFCDIDRCQGIIDGDLLVHYKMIDGIQPNCDTTIQAFGHPTSPSLNWRPLVRYTPWLVGIAGVTWFFARRSKIKKLKNAKALDTPSNGSDVQIVDTTPPRDKS